MTAYLIENTFINKISNQKDEAIATADMITILLRIDNTDGPHVVISPQPLIDAGFNTPYDFQQFCLNGGMERVDTYAFTRIKREGWDTERYENNDRDKHYISDLKYFDDIDQIRDAILQNFGPEGPKYPILCSMYMRDFLDKNIAKNRYVRGNPFRLPPNVRKPPTEEVIGIPEPDHAMLIVGCDTTSEDRNKHKCFVKNSHGKGWGLQGISITAFDSFNYIMVPVHVISPPNQQEEDPQIPLDKEDDPNVLKKCLFVSDLPLFVEIEDIKKYFNNMPLTEDLQDRVDAVCLVSREDLTYTKTAIVKLYLEEDVTSILNYSLHVPLMIGLNVKVSPFEGMKSQSHAYVYTNGKYKMIMSLKNEACENMSEQEIYEAVEIICHPCCSIELLKRDYKFIDQVKIRFRNHKDRKRAGNKATEMNFSKSQQSWDGGN